MQTGYYISGAGHVGLICFMLFGGLLSSEPLPFETTTNVSVISGEEFAALVAQAEPAAVAVQPDQTEAPVEEEAPSVADVTPVEEAPAPVPQEAPEVETPPDVSELTPPVTEVEPDAPVEPAPPAVEDTVTAALPEAERAQEQQADRVAPEPVAPPPPDAAVADTVQEAVNDGETAEQQAEEAEATAPEEAATEIVTEAEEPASAPTQSMRPQTRPSRPAPVETAQETPAEETPAQEAPTDAIADAVAEAVAGTQSDTPAPSGPPLTRGERDALRVAVSSCWNVGSLSTDALATTVVVAVDMAENATPVNSTIRMLSFSGGTEAGARQAFEAARRAIIRCGARGYNLPRDKYAQWREIEMTFDPSGMRLR